MTFCCYTSLLCFVLEYKRQATLNLLLYLLLTLVLTLLLNTILLYTSMNTPISAIPLEDYLIHTLRESQLLRESLKHAWDGEVYRECTFTPFAQPSATTMTMSHVQIPSPSLLSKRLGFVDAIPSPIGW